MGCRSIFSVFAWCAVVCCASSLGVTASVSYAAEPDEWQVGWQSLYRPISVEPGDRSLVLIMITNDVPVAASDDGGPQQWCTFLINDAIRGIVSERPDLKAGLLFQNHTAGLPVTLTGGEPRISPEKALLAICDPNYRLLNFAVGVPTADELLTLVEDAQSVQGTMDLNKTAADVMSDDQRVVKDVVESSEPKLSRLWKLLLRSNLKQIVQRDSEAADEGANLLDPRRQLAKRIQFLSDSYHEPYLLDARTRFGLSDLSDFRRLRILEQHVETRSQWCNAMLPFLAGQDVRLFWRSLAEAVWQQPTVDLESTEAIRNSKDVAAWWDSLSESETVVLSLNQATALSQDQRLPMDEAVADSERGKKRGAPTWNDLSKHIQEHPTRSVSADALAALIDARGLDLIDIQRPAEIRFLIYPANTKTPVIVRQNDQPGITLSRIKRLTR